MIKEIEYPSFSAGTVHRVSWGAIFAGAAISLAVLACLTSLGVGIGLVGAPAAGSARGLVIGMSVWGGVWMLFSGIVSFYAGGWIAGRLTGIARVSESVIHGLVSWGAATLAIGLLTFGALGTAASVFSPSLAGRGNASVSAGTPGGPGTLGTAPGVVPPGAGSAVQAAGAAGLYGFVLMACEAIASGYGARAGTRLLRPMPMSAEVRREHEKTGV